MNAMTFSLFAQGEGPGMGAAIAAMIIPLLFMGAFFVLMFASTWKIFAKAGKPGWGCIIPIYQQLLVCEIAGRPILWFILLLIPVVGQIVGIIIVFDIAKRFGQGAGFGLGMLFLPFIFLPILGFGSAQYQGDAA